MLFNLPLDLDLVGSSRPWPRIDGRLQALGHEPSSHSIDGREADIQSRDDLLISPAGPAWPFVAQKQDPCVDQLSVPRPSQRTPSDLMPDAPRRSGSSCTSPSWHSFPEPKVASQAQGKSFSLHLSVKDGRNTGGIRVPSFRVQDTRGVQVLGTHEPRRARGAAGGVTAQW
jgi:hypothetical protein